MAARRQKTKKELTRALHFTSLLVFSVMASTGIGVEIDDAADRISKLKIGTAQSGKQAWRMIGQAKSVLTILVLQMMANQLGTRTKSATTNSCWMAKRRGGKGTWNKRWFCSNKRSSFTRATNFARGSKNSRYNDQAKHPPKHILLFFAAEINRK